MIGRTSLPLALVFPVVFFGAGSVRGQDSDPAKLSEGARLTYRALLKSPVFVTGSYAGQPNDMYRRLHALLREEGGVEACRTAARYGAPGGRLYAFLCLRVADVSAFREEAERYRAGRPKPEPSLFGFYVSLPPKETKERVERQEGCLGWVGDVEAELRKIEAGAYDEDYKRAVRWVAARSITTASSGRASQRLSQDEVLCAPLMPGVRRLSLLMS